MDIKYDAFYEYKSCYDDEYFTELVKTYGDLRPTDVFVDMGCGSGRTIERLRSYCDVSNILAVDENRACLQKLSEMEGVAAMCMTPELFSTLHGLSYSKVLFQDTAHLLSRDSLQYVMENLYARLPNGGRVIIDQMSSTDAYRLFSSAQERWRNKMARDAYEPVLKGVGFIVEIFRKVFPVRIPREVYRSMMQRRLLGVLKEVSDDELEEGMSRMSLEDPVEYDEVHYFIVAEKVSER